MTLALAGAGFRQASAGDREWAAAGKVLTGVAVGAVIAHALEPRPACVYTPTHAYAPAYTYAPPPPPVVYAPAPSVVYAPAPAACAPAPMVVYTPPPVVYAPAPVVVCRPPPLFSIHFGFGGRQHRHGHR